MNDINTEFILTAVGSAPTGEVTFTNTPTSHTNGTPAFAPINDSNYLLFGNSSDCNASTTSNLASITTTIWNYDTYILADSTDDSADVSGQGKLWTILNLSISGLAAVQYQLTMGSSTWASSTNSALPISNNQTLGGLITVTSVPEPSTMAIAFRHSF